MRMGLVPRNSSTRALACASRAQSTGIEMNRFNAHRSSTPHLLHVNQLLLHAGRPACGLHINYMIPTASVPGANLRTWIGRCSGRAFFPRTSAPSDRSRPAPSPSSPSSETSEPGKGLNEVAQSSSTTTNVPTSEPSIAPRLETSDQTQPLELVAHGSQTVIRNQTQHPIEIVDIRVPSGGKAMTLRSEFPGVVQPGEGFGLIVHDLLGGPAIAAMLVEWRSVDGQLRLTKFFV